MNAFRRGLGRLVEEEEGASMIFAAITLFSVTASIVFVLQSGVVSADRLQVQNAADAAAYSAAQVEANALNSIGQINDGMAYVNYMLLRYTVDAIVYGTLHEYETHPGTPATGQYGYVLMGGPQSNQYEGNRRYQHVRNMVLPSGGDAIGRAKRWLRDLHYASRIIMATTPRLARDTAIHVARENGATHVAMSEDLERAFIIEEHFQAGLAQGATRQGSGFSEGTGDIDPSLHRRYAERFQTRQFRSLQPRTPQNLAQALPQESWFDPTRGLTDPNAYFQWRLCWNDDDWKHDKPGQPHGRTFRYSRGAPNGHWHYDHPHYYFDPNVGIQIVPGTPHGDSLNGNDMGGHYQDAASEHSQATWDLPQRNDSGPDHHAEWYCGTCWLDPYSRPQRGGASWTEVRKSAAMSRDTQLRQLFFVNYNQAQLIFPRPLKIRQELLKSGVTVVAYRTGRGVGALFPASDWGMLAVASASLGYQVQGQGVVPLTQLTGGTANYQGPGGNGTVPYLGAGGNDTTYRNLFYSDTPNLGVRFGARLVPVADAETWHQTLGNAQGLQRLLEGRVRWYDTRSTTGGAMPGEVANLQQFLRVNNQNGLNAFWH